MLSRLFASRQRPYIWRRHDRDKVAIDFSGSYLTFSLLPDAFKDGFADLSQEPPNSVNIFDDSNYSSDTKRETWKREGIGQQTLMRRSWELYGPIWRSIGTIDFVLTLYRHDAMPEGMSCFNPQHFETVIMRHLYYLGPCIPDGRIQKAPINWQLRNLDGATAIFFEKHRLNPPEVLAECPHHETYFSSCFFVPLDQRRYLIFNFRYLGYAPVEPCIKAMNGVRDTLCDSVELQLSSAAKKQLVEARKRWPKAEASTNRGIESWVYPEWHKAGEYDEKIIITKPGSPPPPWQAQAG